MIKKNLALNEMGFLFNPTTGDSFSSNIIGAKIITDLKNGISLSEIKFFLIENYEVEKSTVEKDVDEFMSLLKDYQLLD